MTFASQLQDAFTAVGQRLKNTPTKEDVYDGTKIGLVPIGSSGYLKADGTWDNPNDHQLHQKINDTLTSFLPVILSGTSLITEKTSEGYISTNVNYQPSTGTLRASVLQGSLDWSYIQSKPQIFTGTTETVAGTYGFVPAPQITDTNKFLKSDGTWAEFTGLKGENGVTPNITVGAETLDSDQEASVVKTGTLTNPIFTFGIPRGTTPKLSVGSVTTLTPGSKATVTLSGSDEEPVLNFSIPKGDTGAAGTAEVGTGNVNVYIGASEPGDPASNVLWVDTDAEVDEDLSHEIVAATITVGTVTKGDTFTVTNSGTAANAILDFTYPEIGTSSSSSSSSIDASALEPYALMADLATVATTGKYSDLIDLPTIPTVPTVVSAFTNDAGYLTSHQSLNAYAKLTDIPDLTGYAKLTDIPEIPDVSIYALAEDIPDVSSFVTQEYVDNNDIKEISVISNSLKAKKGNNTYITVSGLPTVAITGSFNDLTDKPTFISTVIWDDIQGKPDTVSKAQVVQEVLTALPTYYTGTSDPSTEIGSDGDLYFVTE